VLNTWLTRTAGLRVPLVNAPMTPAAGGRLARAVSDAGGLGFVGIDSRDEVTSVRDQVTLARAGRPDVPLGIGLMAWVLPSRLELLDLVLELQPTFVSISFGDPAPYVDALHRRGILVASQVQDRESALAASAAGVDAIVSQGTEAGGHTGAVGTLTLLQIVLESVAQPVLAAGGIASARGVAAVLGAGAEGVWVGTPFLLAAESRVADATRSLIARSREGDTVLTHVFDVAQGLAWPARFPGRAIANEFTAEWHGREDELSSNFGALERFARAKREGDVTLSNVYAGQSIGLLANVEPAAAIVARLMNGAEELLRLRPASILSD